MKIVNSTSEVLSTTLQMLSKVLTNRCIGALCAIDTFSILNTLLNSFVYLNDGFQVIDAIYFRNIKSLRISLPMFI